jgi:hypothetical protein
MVMTEEHYNPNDVLFLISCGLDETFSDEQQRVVDGALAESPYLRKQADALRATAVNLARWSKQPVDCDWTGHAQSISDRIGDAASDEFDQLDALLGRWSATRPSFNADAFTANVMARVDGASTGGVSKVLFRIGVPLAAAAAIALAVVGTLWLQAPLVPSIHVVYESSAVYGADGSRTDSPKCYVAFRREPVVQRTIGDGVPGLSFISVGSSPLIDSFEEQPPI